MRECLERPVREGAHAVVAVAGALPLLHSGLAPGNTEEA
jgi:hypothetical protein